MSYYHNKYLYITLVQNNPRRDMRETHGKRSSYGYIRVEKPCNKKNLQSLSF